jgi:glycerol kinase
VVQRSLADWHPAAIAAYEDLHRFVIDKLPKGNDKAQRREILELSVGTWIVWNVTDKAKLANEFEIISAVASLVAREFTGYWQQQL